MSLACVPIPDYCKPFHWWGNAWQPTSAASLNDLLTWQVLSGVEADFLVGALDRGQSLAVVSNASGAGKSTLLWALSAAASTARPRVFIRGQYEPFTFGPLIVGNPPSALLMINEISPHLPVYCWGRAHDRLFGPEFVSYQKAATAHATSLAAFLGRWQSSNTSSPSAIGEPFDVAVFLSPDPEGGSTFRVRDIQSAAR